MSVEQFLREIDKTDIVQLLSELVSIPSYDNEEKIVEYLAQRLDGIGVHYEITEVEPARQNLTASVGEGKPILIFNTHTDTVPPGELENWRNPPLELTRDGEYLSGLGACDAKGCLASMLTAFEMLARDAPSMNGKLILQAVCCEETRARGTLAEVARGVTADAAIVGEPTGLVPMIGHKGGLGMDITVHGKAAHGSRPQDGINAISAAAAIIKKLDELAERVALRCDPLFGCASLAVTQVAGGKAPNVIPDRCTLTLDRRLIPGDTIDRAMQEILKIVSKTVSKTQKSGLNLTVSTEKTIGIDACKISLDEPVVDIVTDSVNKVKKGEVKASGFPACCDMWCLVEGAGIPTMILGPGETSMAHKANENIRVSELYEAAKIYAAIALNFFKHGVRK